MHTVRLAQDGVQTRNIVKTVMEDDVPEKARNLQRNHRCLKKGSDYQIW